MLPEEQVVFRILVIEDESTVAKSILDRQEPSPQDFAAKQDQIRDSIRQARQVEMFNLFVSNLRTQMEKSGKIKINQEEMNNLTRSQGGEQGE